MGTSLINQSNSAAWTDSAPMAQIVDSNTSGTVYICEGPVGASVNDAVWRCRKVVTATNVATTTWAGSANFNQVAANRSSLVYA